MATETKVTFGLVDVTAKADSTPTATDKQTFADLDDLKLDTVTPLKVATFETDFWKLDGTFSLFPDTPSSYEWGYWSLSMSDSNGDFTVPPVMTITFTTNHTSSGLTLYFDELNSDYANSVNIKWYDSAGTLLDDQNFTPDTTVYFCDNSVTDYRKIVITFNSTNKPYRFLKLYNIAYGEIKLFGSSDIVSANIVEEVNVLSSEISINTFNLRLHSNDALFDILNPQGVYEALQQKQPLTVTETVNGVIKQMGTFYLDEWENDTENTVKLTGIDLVGIIDKTTFKGGIYSSETVANIIDEIMDSADAEYDLDSSYSAVTLSGWVPICTHREALQQVAFAIGAIVDCSRGNKIYIYPISDTTVSNIPSSRKFLGQKVTLKPIVTGVEVTAHNYTEDTTSEEIFNDTLTTGTHEIQFDEPYHDLSITGATISESGANYAILSVSSGGTVILNGQKYIDSTKIFSVYMSGLPANEKTNVLKVKDATLVSNSNGQTTAQRIYDYYQKRYKYEGQIILDSEEVGSTYTIDSLNSQKIKGVVESLEIDLTGGFLAKAVIAGVVDGS